MAPPRARIAAQFLALHHRDSGFVLPNAWDAGSARILHSIGFPAVATTSAGISFSRGRPDGTLERDVMLAAVADIVGAVDCPVTADLEAGYGTTPSDVASTVAAAVGVGAVGANVEDQDPATGRQFDIAEAAERLAAARSASPVGQFVLNARVDTYLVGANRDPASRFDDAVARASAYVGAGADCVFVPGADDADTISRLVDGIGAPLNIVAGLTPTTLRTHELFSLGVARISIGGSLARATLGFVERAGRELRDRGTFGYLDHSIPHPELQQRFAPPSQASSLP